MRLYFARRRCVDVNRRPPATSLCVVQAKSAATHPHSRHDKAVTSSREHHEQNALLFSECFSLVVSSSRYVTLFQPDDEHPVELLTLACVRIEEVHSWTDVRCRVRGSYGLHRGTRSGGVTL